MSEEALRARAVEVALSYQGTQYRWGGKSPLGVDCSGLTFMAWFFCGVSLYRDARLVDGFPARPIPFEARKPGDLLSISPAISPSIWGTTGTSTPPPGRAATG